MTFNYELSVWGRGTAGLRTGDPTSIRLRRTLKALAPLREGEMALEVGCGAGQFIRAIKELRPELVCHGSDISRKALEQARKKLDGVLYSEQQGNDLPYADGLFSAVVIFDVLEHVDDPTAFLREVNRVLRSGGILYAFVPCEGDVLSFWHLLKFFNICVNLTEKFAGHIQYFSRHSLVNLVKSNGFRIKSISYSEHILGQLLGVAAFLSMDVSAKARGLEQINNETYFTENFGGVRFRWLRRLVNTLIFLESFLFRRVPSPNVHLVAEKE